jgi:6-pyruvoyltetrahydropterin/6-carboxytetrahydropterin synthase
VDVNITRKIEFDAGHRIPDHASKCRNIHGHRYVLEATVRGPVNPIAGKSDDGMVVDFGDLKTLMNRVVGDKWDHAFLVSTHDVAMVSLLDDLDAIVRGGHKTVIMPNVPTVENLAATAFAMLDEQINATFAGSPFKLYHVRLYETPNCWADVYATKQED